jgi:hypothetical protein
MGVKEKKIAMRKTAKIINHKVWQWGKYFQEFYWIKIQHSHKASQMKTCDWSGVNKGSDINRCDSPSGCGIVNQLMGSEPSPSHNCIYPMTIHISTHTKSAAQVTSIQKDHTLHKSEIQHKRRLCNSRVTSLKPLNHVKCRGYKPYRVKKQQFMITESSQFNIHIHLILLFTFRYELKRFDTKRRNRSTLDH